MSHLLANEILCPVFSFADNQEVISNYSRSAKTFVAAGRTVVMCEKIKKVNSWLGAVFGEQAVPQFEVNTRTVDILHRLAQSSEARCSDTALLIEDLTQKAAEYQAEISRVWRRYQESQEELDRAVEGHQPSSRTYICSFVQRETEGALPECYNMISTGLLVCAHLQDVLLQSAGLSFASLSKPAADYLSALVENAMVLGVRDTSLGSFMPAVNNLTNELLEAEKSNRRLERELRALRKRLGATLVLRGSLQEDINKTVKAQAVESAKAEERLLNMDFVTAKANELSNRRQRSEAQLVSRNMDKSITHQALVQLSEEVTALKKEIIPLKKKLEPYMDLSPSPSLAQVKIEEAKRELAALDSQLEMKVDFK